MPATRLAPGPVEASEAEAAVRLAYRTVLGREADAGGLATYAAALRNGRDLVWLLQAMAGSDEFRDRCARASATGAGVARALDAGLVAPMAVDAACGPEALQALWDHVARTWSRLGDSEPHWSVLTQDEYRAEALGPAQLAAFYASGADEVSRFRAWLRRAGITPRADAVCAEYGCGVARVTGGLARLYGRVLAFDVSAPHLRAARARCEADGIGTVEFVQVTGPSSLGALRDLDVFFSVIVLQHSPPPIILDILGRAFAALRPGGYAYFQVPTYAAGYRYSAAEHLAQVAAGDGTEVEMEMHFVPQGAVLDLARRAGLAVAEVQPDFAIGLPDRQISNTFLLVRR